MPLGSYVRPEAQEWLRNHKHFLEWPNPLGCDWLAWVNKWLKEIAATPIQPGFLKSIVRMKRALDVLSKTRRLPTIVIY